MFKCFHLYPQKLLEEIEKNRDKIENCQKNAKDYIDSVKVCTDTFSFARKSSLFSGLTSGFLSFFLSF